MKPIRILHTNDFHGTLTPEKAARIRAMRDRADLYFDSGDLIKAGNLAIPFAPDPSWPLLAAAGCDASVPGNRESHVLESAFRTKISGHTHPLLCANLYDKRGNRVLEPYKVFGLPQGRVGVFGVMVPMVTATMAGRAASAFLWTQPIDEAQKLVPVLRGECDIVIALTHIGFKRDVELASAVEGIDIILGGHSHTVLEAPERVGNTWICQGGSHGRFIGEYVWDGTLIGRLSPL